MGRLNRHNCHEREKSVGNRCSKMYILQKLIKKQICFNDFADLYVNPAFLI